MPESADHYRPIRSFVRREGRLTTAQQRALDELWPHYGVPADGEVLDPASLFGRRAPLWLEIGFGNGEVLRHMAASHPGIDFLGIEVHRPGIGHLLNGLAGDGLDNVRVMTGDAADILREQIGAGSLSRVLVFFPDPWPKKRHHKRRLIQPAFVDELARALVPDGILHLATDWADYAAHMHGVLEAHSAFADAAHGGRPGYRPPTRFEERGLRKGHAVEDLLYRRRG